MKRREIAVPGCIPNQRVYTDSRQGSESVAGEEPGCREKWTETPTAAVASPEGSGRRRKLLMHSHCPGCRKRVRAKVVVLSTVLQMGQSVRLEGGTFVVPPRPLAKLPDGSEQRTSGRVVLHHDITPVMPQFGFLGSLLLM